MNKKIDSFFKRSAPTQKENCSSSSASVEIPKSNHELSEMDLCPTKNARIEPKSFDITTLERDPGIRSLIWNYVSHDRDEVRRTYWILGPYQQTPPSTPDYVDRNGRRFLSSWYNIFPEWLEFSLKTKRVYCLPCFLFTKPLNRPGSCAFVVDGFQGWKKVNEGIKCPFVKHVGKDQNSAHKQALRSCHDMMNSSQHIERCLEKQYLQQVEKNRLQLKVSNDVTKWLAFQGCAFRGHDESEDSTNRGNFIELVKLLASYSEDVNAVVLQNASRNAMYTSPKIQKEILHIFSCKIQKFIRDEINDAKFCIIVDEARDESKREQMAIVLRFVDKVGFIKERFFDIIHVEDTSALTLKKKICDVLTFHGLDINNIRGQGYDGASNMRGEWNGLQALFINECPFAYYIHCLAHRLQLTLVASSKDVIPVCQFFTYLSLIINLVCSSCKRNDQLKAAHAVKIAELIAIDELDTGKGLNQIGNLKRAGDTRWGSHLSSLRSLVRMFDATCVVLQELIKEGNSSTQRSEADGAYIVITSFDFIFILHLMIEILQITDDLCQALQRKSQDILNAMHLVSTTKHLLQSLRETGWQSLLQRVTLFCEKREIHIPDMNAPYSGGRGHSRRKKDVVTIEHHYKVDVFIATLDTQQQEMNMRFNDHVVELLIFSAALDPRDEYESFKIDDICQLANKFYREDFTDAEKLHLKIQLEHFIIEACQNHAFQNLSTISDLCQMLAKTRKSVIYHLIDRLLRLILTLPVSTATTERAFSAMKIVKTRLRNKMEDDFLASSLITYIEKDIAMTFEVESIIDDFDAMKNRRAQFKLPKSS